jgi:hypothetical protein
MCLSKRKANIILIYLSGLCETKSYDKKNHINSQLPYYVILFPLLLTFVANEPIISLDNVSFIFFFAVENCLNCFFFCFTLMNEATIENLSLSGIDKI